MMSDSPIKVVDTGEVHVDVFPQPILDRYRRLIDTTLVILPTLDVVHPLHLQLIHYHELIELLQGWNNPIRDWTPNLPLQPIDPLLHGSQGRALTFDQRRLRRQHLSNRSRNPVSLKV